MWHNNLLALREHHSLSQNWNVAFKPINGLSPISVFLGKESIVMCDKVGEYSHEAIKELADAIEKPPYLWNESQLWQAYAALEKSKVKGASGRRILTDLVSLVRFAIHQESELIKSILR